MIAAVIDFMKFGLTVIVPLLSLVAIVSFGLHLRRMWRWNHGAWREGTGFFSQKEYWKRGTMLGSVKREGAFWIAVVITKMPTGSGSKSWAFASERGARECVELEGE